MAVVVEIISFQTRIPLFPYTVNLFPYSDQVSFMSRPSDREACFNNPVSWLLSGQWTFLFASDRVLLATGRRWLGGSRAMLLQYPWWWLMPLCEGLLFTTNPLRAGILLCRASFDITFTLSAPNVRKRRLLSSTVIFHKFILQSFCNVFILIIRIVKRHHPSSSLITIMGSHFLAPLTSSTTALFYRAHLALLWTRLWLAVRLPPSRCSNHLYMKGWGIKKRMKEKEAKLGDRVFSEGGRLALQKFIS